MVKCEKLECVFLDFLCFVLSHLSHLPCEIASTSKSLPSCVAPFCWIQSTLPIIYRDCGRKEKQSLTTDCCYPRKMKCRTSSVIKKFPPDWMRYFCFFWKESPWREESIQVKNSTGASSCLNYYENVIGKALKDFKDHSICMMVMAALSFYSAVKKLLALLKNIYKKVNLVSPCEQRPKHLIPQRSKRRQDGFWLKNAPHLLNK